MHHCDALLLTRGSAGAGASGSAGAGATGAARAARLVERSAALIGVTVAVAELLTPLANSIVSGHRVALTPDPLQGRVQAAGVLITQSVGWLGPLAVGVAFEHAGQAATVVAVAAVAAALAVGATASAALRAGPPTPSPTTRSSPPPR